MKIAANITELIGNTPLVKLKFAENEIILLAKCKFMNPSGSVKDRIGSKMIITMYKYINLIKNRINILQLKVK